MFDLAEEELNTVLNETNGNPTDREENPADVLKISEPDSLSYESLQYQFGSDNMIQPKEASPAIRQKRSHVDPCYSGKDETVKLASGEVKKFPICKNVTFIGCESSIEKHGRRKCEPEKVTVRVLENGATQIRGVSRKCSCA